MYLYPPVITLTKELKIETFELIYFCGEIAPIKLLISSYDTLDILEEINKKYNSPMKPNSKIEYDVGALNQLTINTGQLILVRDAIDCDIMPYRNKINALKLCYETYTF